MSINDQIDFITREVNLMKPTSASSSSGTVYSGLAKEKLEQYHRDFNTRLVALKAIESDTSSTPKLQAAIQMVENELSHINFELAHDTRFDRLYY